MVFKCQICSIDFSVEKEFTKHARSHNCFDCKQIFVSPQGKLDHVKKAHPVKTQPNTKEVSLDFSVVNYWNFAMFKSSKWKNFFVII